MKTESLYSIVYISEHAPDLNYEEFRALDVMHNRAMDANRITGSLTTINGNAIQVLEGNRQVLIPLFEKIQANTKHQNLTVIWNGEIKNRNFSDYTVLNMHDVAPENMLSLKESIKLKIQSHLNGHEKNIAQSIYLETIWQMS